MLGRKGTLAGSARIWAKLAPEERASVGKALNAAKQALEARTRAQEARI